MRILHIISQAPDFTGSEKFIQQILFQSAKNGHDNFLVVGGSRGLLHCRKALLKNPIAVLSGLTAKI